MIRTGSSYRYVAPRWSGHRIPAIRTSAKIAFDLFCSCLFTSANAKGTEQLMNQNIVEIDWSPSFICRDDAL
jgi:hypothetical protein